MLHRHPVYQKRMLHRHRVYVPSAGAGGCAIRSLVGRGMRYKKSGRHYSCMGRVSREGQCEMWSSIKNGMRNALNIHRERIPTRQLTPSPGYDVPLLRLRSRECFTAILYTSRECSTAIRYTRRECSSTIVYTYPVLHPGYAL